MTHLRQASRPQHLAPSLEGFQAGAYRDARAYMLDTLSHKLPRHDGLGRAIAIYPSKAEAEHIHRRHPGNRSSASTNHQTPKAVAALSPPNVACVLGQSFAGAAHSTCSFRIQQKGRSTYRTQTVTTRDTKRRFGAAAEAVCTTRRSISSQHQRSEQCTPAVWISLIWHTVPRASNGDPIVSRNELEPVLCQPASYDE